VSFSYGMIVSSELMAQLRRRPVMVEHPSLILKTTYRLNNDQRLLHGHGMLSEIGWVEDVVEHYERATGVVQWDQMEKHAQDWGAGQRAERRYGLVSRNQWHA
jgi:hypothetical protein